MVLAWVGYIVLSWLAADFLSGLFHWLEDVYARPEWPLIGRLVAIPNLIHHDSPTMFTKGTYWTRNWTTLVPALATALLWRETPAWLLFVFLSQANEIHAWSHQRCNVWIRTLQETGIVQGPISHAKHHKSPFSIRYCVMSDWINPLLDAIGFWRMLECGLSWIAIHPRELKTEKLD